MFCLWLNKKKASLIQQIAELFEHIGDNYSALFDDHENEKVAKVTQTTKYKEILLF